MGEHARRLKHLSTMDAVITNTHNGKEWRARERLHKEAKRAQDPLAKPNAEKQKHREALASVAQVAIAEGRIYEPRNKQKGAS